MKKALVSLLIVLGLTVVGVSVVASNQYHVVTVGGECEDNCKENGWFAYADTSTGYRYFIELKDGEGTAKKYSKYIVKNIDGTKREVTKVLPLNFYSFN